MLSHFDISAGSSASFDRQIGYDENLWLNICNKISGPATSVKKYKDIHLPM